MYLDPDQRVRLAAIGWRGDDAPQADPAATLARVIAQHRNGYVAHDGENEFPVQPAPRFLRRDVGPEDRPAVGDFVWLKPGKPPLIDAILPRRSTLVRGAAGESYRRQIIATNIDFVLVLMGLDGDFNPRRLERYLLLIEGSGAQPVIVLTKADRHADVAVALAEVATIVPPGTLLHAINAKDAAGVAPLHVYVGSGMSAVLVGSSGAGKSTLTNTLLGVERQATGAVRDHDSRGRHTTTRRTLIRLPQGGCLIDTPGMRELKLTGDEDIAGAAQFTDIEMLAALCRFGDCAHRTEPGCAMRAALDAGTLEPERWESYVKLRAEAEVQADTLEAQLKRKSQARILGKALHQRLRDKYGR